MNENYGYNDLSSICCFCFSQNNNLIPMNHRTEQDVPINTKVTYTFPELVSLDPEIPLFVCCTCVVTVTTFYVFKIKCLENIKRLLQYVAIAKQKQVTNENLMQRTQQQTCSQSTNLSRNISFSQHVQTTKPGRVSKNPETQNSVLSFNTEEHTQITTQVAVENTSRNLERQDTMLIFHDAYRNQERQGKFSTNREEYTQAILPATGSHDAYRNLEEQGTVLPSNRGEYAQPIIPGAIFYDVYSNQERQAAVLPSNENGRTHTTNPGTVFESATRNLERQDTILTSNRKERLQPILPAIVSQDAYKNLERPSNREDRTLKTNLTILTSNEQEFTRPIITPATVSHDAYRNPERQGTVLPSDIENHTLKTNADTNTILTSNRGESTQPIISATVSHDAYRNPERQATVLPSSGDDPAHITNLSTVFENESRNITRQDTILTSKRHEVKQTTSSISLEQMRATLLTKISQKSYKNQVRQEKILPINTKNSKTVHEIAPGRPDTVITASVEKHTQAAIPVFRKSSRNSERQNTILTTIREEQRITNSVGFGNAHRNIKRSNTVLQSSKEDRTEATGPATVFENLPKVRCVQNACRNLGNQNKILTPNKEKHIETSLPAIENASSKKLESQEPAHKNLETQYTIPISDGEERCTIGKKDKVLYSNEQECTQPTNSATVFENAYKNQETQNTILVSYDDEHIEMKSTNVKNDVVPFNNLSIYSAQCETKVKIEETIVISDQEHIQNNPVSDSIELEEYLDLFHKQLIKQENNDTSFENNFERDKLRIKEVDSVSKNERIQQNFTNSFDSINGNVNHIETRPIEEYDNKSKGSNVKLEESLLSEKCMQENLFNDLIEVKENVIPYDNKTDCQFYQELVKSVNSSSESNNIEPNKYTNNVRRTEEQKNMNISGPESILENRLKRFKQNIQNVLPNPGSEENSTKNVIHISNNRPEEKNQTKLTMSEVTVTTSGFTKKIINKSQEIEDMDDSFEVSNSIPEDEHMQLNDIDIKEDIVSFDRSSVKKLYEELKPTVHSKPISNDLDVCIRNAYFRKVKANTQINNSKSASVNNDNIKVKCPICSEELLKSYLRSHLMCHGGIQDFECSICRKKLLNYFDMKIHLRNHKEFKKFSCSICNKSFKTKTYLEIHKKTHSKMHTEDKIDCLHCDKKFVHKEALKVHMIHHTREKKYECSVCHKKFVFKIHCKRHEKSHTNNHSCEICKKIFPRSANLWQHMQIHKGKKKFECKICNKNFLHNSHLKQHEFTHTGVKNYKCTNCNKAFALPGSLRKHMETHGKSKSNGRKMKSETESEAETETESDDSWSESKSDQETEIDDSSSE